MKAIHFELNTADLYQIESHLLQCANNFIPPLHTITLIPDYAQKIHSLGYRFEAWNETKLIGLVACYLNNFETKIGYITNVSIDEVYMGNGLAKELLKRVCNYAIGINFTSIELRVNCDNQRALALYKTCNFLLVNKIENDYLMKINLVDDTAGC